MSAMMQSTMMGAKLVVPTRGAPKAGRSAVVCSASAEDARRAVRHPGAHAFYSAARVKTPGHASRPLAASLEQLDTGVWPYSPSDGAWAPRQVVSLVAAASVTLGVVGAAFADGATYAPLQDDTKKNAGVFLCRPGAARPIAQLQRVSAHMRQLLCTRLRVVTVWALTPTFPLCVPGPTLSSVVQACS
jgi:hypothetical protein